MRKAFVLKNGLSKFIKLAIMSVFVLTNAGCKTVSQDAKWEEVTYTKEKLNQIQREVDEGHLVGNLDPQQVAMDFALRQLGASNWSHVRVEELPENRKKVSLVGELGTIILVLTQPVRKDPTGIWVVEKFRWVTP